MALRDSWSGAAQYTHLGLTIAMMVLGGFFGGYWIDSKFDTIPLFAIFGTFVGASTGIFSMIRTLNRMRDDMEREDSKDNIEEND